MSSFFNKLTNRVLKKFVSAVQVDNMSDLESNQFLKTVHIRFCLTSTGFNPNLCLETNHILFESSLLQSYINRSQV